MPARPVRTTRPVDSIRIHRFQVVRERRSDGGHQDWIVVDFTTDAVILASLDFEWHRTVPQTALERGDFEPLTAGGVPVWGY